MKILKYSLLLIVFLYSCSGDKNKNTQAENTTPQVLEKGNKIVFYNAESISFFETENISSSDLSADMVAPAKVSATIIKSEEGGAQNLVLFENPDLASNYTQLIQHSININQIQNIKIKALDHIAELIPSFTYIGLTRSLRKITVGLGTNV